MKHVQIVYSFAVILVNIIFYQILKRISTNLSVLYLNSFFSVNFNSDLYAYADAWPPPTGQREPPVRLQRQDAASI